MAIITPKFFWPWDATGKTTVRLWNGTTVVSGTVSAVSYLSAALLAAALQTALQTAGFTGMLVTVTSTGRFRFAWGTPFEFRGGDGLNTMANHIGFFSLTTASVNDATKYGGATPHGVEASFQHVNGWYPPLPPRSDTLDMRDRSSNVTTRSMTGVTRQVIEPELTERMLTFSWLPPEYTFKAYEGSTTFKNAAVENMFENGWGKVRMFPDATLETGYADYLFSQDAMRRFAPKRMYQKKALYEYELELWGYVP